MKQDGTEYKLFVIFDTIAKDWLASFDLPRYPESERREGGSPSSQHFPIEGMHDVTRAFESSDERPRSPSSKGLAQMF